MAGVKISGLPNSATALETDIEPIVQGGVTKKLEFSVRKNDLLNVPEYVKGWNANTNTPSLASGTGIAGTVYIVNEAGATNLDGITSWLVGDYAYFNGVTWEKIESLSKSATNIIYVDPVGGNDSTADGTIGRQFKTIAAANAFITTASAVNPFAIIIASGIVNEVIIEKKPYVSYIGSSRGSVIFTSAGSFVLSADHATSVSNVSEVRNITLDSCNLTFNGLLYPGGVWSIELNGVDTTNSKITLSSKSTQQYIYNDIDWYSTTAGQQTTVDGGLITMNSGRIYSYEGKATVTAGASTLNFLGGLINIFDLRTDSNCTATIRNCAIITSLTLREIAASLVLNIDSDSVPSNGIAIAGGPGVPTINYITSSPHIRASYTAINYTPTTPQIQGHLAGIDTKLGTVDTSIYTSNGSLTSARTVTLASNKLEFVEGAENVRIRDTVNHPSSILALNSTTRTFLLTRQTTGQRTSIASPVEGLITQDTDIEAPFVYARADWRAIRSSLASELDNLIELTANSFMTGVGVTTSIINSQDGVVNLGQAAINSIYANYRLKQNTENVPTQWEIEWSPAAATGGNVVFQVRITYTDTGSPIGNTNYIFDSTFTVAAPLVSNQRVTQIIPLAAINVKSFPTRMYSLNITRLGNDVNDTLSGNVQISFAALNYSEVI